MYRLRIMTYEEVLDVRRIFKYYFKWHCHCGVMGTKHNLALLLTRCDYICNGKEWILTITNAIHTEEINLA